MKIFIFCLGFLIIVGVESGAFNVVFGALPSCLLTLGVDCRLVINPYREFLTVLSAG